MEEVWKDIQDYEGIYQVSNFGNVKSLNRETFDSVRKQIKKLKGRMLKSAIDSRGYKSVVLTKNGKQRTYRVHNLVALAFCNGYKKGLVVNHKDENQLNNFYKNLEWCTQKENVWYSRIRKKCVGKELKGADNIE